MANDSNVSHIVPIPRMEDACEMDAAALFEVTEQSGILYTCMTSSMGHRFLSEMRQFTEQAFSDPTEPLPSIRSINLLAKLLDHLDAYPAFHLRLKGTALVAVWHKQGASVSIEFAEVVTLAIVLPDQSCRKIFDRHIVLDEVLKALIDWTATIPPPSPELDSWSPGAPRFQPSSFGLTSARRQDTAQDAFDDDIAF